MNAQSRQPRSGLGFWLFVMAFVVAMAMIGDVGHVIIHREIPLQMGFKPDANATVVVTGLQASVHGWTTVAVPLGSLGAPAITFLIAADVARTVVAIVVAVLWVKCVRAMRLGLVYEPKPLRILARVTWTAVGGFALFCVLSTVGETFAAHDLGTADLQIRGESMATIVQFLIIATGSLSLWLGIRFGAITRATAEAPLGAQRTPHPTTREEIER